MKTARENDTSRFKGNGNWADAENRTRRGWCVICMHCGRQSKPVITSRDKPVPPEGIRQRLARDGWLVGDNANEDECQDCLKQTRDEAIERKQLHESNVRRVNHLHEMITKLDQFLNNNIAMHSTPEFLTEHMELIRAFGSLLETAFIYDIVPAKWKEQPVPYSRVAHLQKILDATTADERVAFFSTVVLPPSPVVASTASHHVFNGAVTVLGVEPDWPTESAVPTPTPAPKPAPAPVPKPPARSNISPKLAELRDRARRQLNGV